MEWSIQQIARIAGTTSRTLRHYGDLGLVTPSRIGQNGYRFYDERALVRLQRVLLLRELGLGLPAIAEILEQQRDERSALTTHVQLLRHEQERLSQQIAAVEHTIRALSGEETLMSETMFEGFDHTQYKEEVEARWGTDAYAQSDRWWRSLSEQDRQAWQARTAELIREWIDAASTPEIEPGDAEAQDLAHRPLAWLRGAPGMGGPGSGGATSTVGATLPAANETDESKSSIGGSGVGDTAFREKARGIAEMYVADARFAETYGGVERARFVRDAILIALDTAE